MAKNGTENGNNQPLDFKKFMEQKTKELKPLAVEAKYLKFEKVGEFNFIANGIKTYPKDGQEVEIVELSNPIEDTNFVNGSTLLVSAIKRHGSFPCFVRIIYKGKKTTANGEMDDLEIYTA